ncbi:MAG: DUF4367 domain-containing protein [Clostridiaceae bacterium]|nr:DUF4367 domain-containing protein [Clostridiaceae bacterium]
MTEQQIVEYLHGYITAEMNLLEESEMPDYEHKFSKKFRKKIRRMFWSEKYFGNKIHLGYVVRKIAIIVLIVTSLFTANQVSAKVFDFDIWKYVVSFLAENRMDEKTYTEKTTSKQEECLKAKKNVPETIPKNFKENVRLEDTNDLYVEWKYGEEYLQYDRVKLSEGLSIATDAEYDYKEKITVSGYSCEYCVKGQEAWMIWDDLEYGYQIIATNITEAKEVLTKMMEDIYLK